MYNCSGMLGFFFHVFRSQISYRIRNHSRNAVMLSEDQNSRWEDSLQKFHQKVFTFVFLPLVFFSKLIFPYEGTRNVWNCIFPKYLFYNQDLSKIDFFFAKRLIRDISMPKFFVNNRFHLGLSFLGWIKLIN